MRLYVQNLFQTFEMNFFKKISVLEKNNINVTRINYIKKRVKLDNIILFSGKSYSWNNI